MPSHASGSGPVHAPILAPGHMIRRRIVVGSLLFVFVALTALIVFFSSGNFMPLLRKQAEQALLNVIPAGMSAELGKTDVALLWPPSLGITYSDVEISGEDGEAITVVKKLTLGVKASSLLDGVPEFTKVQLSGVEYRVRPATDTQLPVMRIDAAKAAFDRLSKQIGQGGRQFFFQDDGVAINVSDVTVELPNNGYSRKIGISKLDISARNGTATFSGELEIDNYVVPVSGQANLIRGADEETDRLDLAMKAQGAPMPWRDLQTLVSDDQTDHVPGVKHAPLLADVALVAKSAAGAANDVFELNVVPKDMAFKLDVGDYVPVNGRISIAMDFATPAMTIKPDKWDIGRSTFVLSGRIRDAYETSGRNAFEFEMLANKGTMSASDAPTAPVRFAARAHGIGLLEKRLIQFSKLEVDSDSGSAVGQGDISLDGDFQTAVFEVLVKDMAIAGVKQFWPAPVARGARRWVLNNLAGGRVNEGRFDIAEPLRRRIAGTDKELTGATKVALTVEGVRFDVTGDIPPVRDANGSVSFADGVTTVSLDKGTVFLPSGRSAEARDGLLTIFAAKQKGGPVRANLDLGVSGEARAIGELITFNPINANQFYPFKADDLSGSVDGRVNVDFILNGGASGPQPDWSVDFKVANAGSAAKIEGRALDNLNGHIQVDPRRADFDLQGTIDGLPADIAMVVPFGNSGVKAKRDISLNLSTKDREKLAPGLNTILTGTTPVKVNGGGGATRIEASLTGAKLALPWIGWAKGSGIKASTAFDLLQNGSSTSLTDFKLSGNSFGVSDGRIDVDKAGLKGVRFGSAKLNKNDNFSLDMKRNGQGYAITVKGKSLDARAMMRHVRAEARRTTSSSGSTPIDMTATIGRVQGFHGEYLSNVTMDLRVRGGTVTRLNLKGTTKSGFPVFLTLDGAGSGRSIKVEALGAGEFLRFADIYTNVRGGTLNVSLRGTGPQSLAGKADLFDFRVFNEPKLAQLVSTRSSGSQSLEQAVNKQIDTREIKFERASSDLLFKPGRLDVSQAVARGPLVGFTIQGKVFDSQNRTRLTGTFLPAYGINSLFAEIPILGLFLGNGRDRGLIGVTFKLDGSFDNPAVTVNPLSVIAPGIFRSIFEFK